MGLCNKNLKNIRSGRFNTEPFDNDGYPETRLWAAVVLQSINEYEHLLQRIQGTWLSSNRPVNRAHYEALANVREQCKSTWFVQVCELAGFDQLSVLNKFSNLEKMYGLINVVFTEQQSVVSRYMREKQRRSLYRV